MRLRATRLALLFSWLLCGFGQNKPDSTGWQKNPAAAAPEAPPFVTCPAGGPLGALDLRVQDGDQNLPFRGINHLGEGQIVTYAPIIRGKQKRPGEIALVLVPEKREHGEPDIILSDPKPADKPQSWKVDRTISVAALVYGPSGLSRKKVSKFLSQDEVLIAQLADYADKTEQAEQLVSILSNSESSRESVNAALNGFASQYGFAVQIDRNAPISAQASTLFAAMNPQLANYNPLGSSTAQAAGQTASLATMAGTLFFGSPIGLAAGGTAMLLDLRAIAFPDTQFRASFAEPLKHSQSGVNLCGQQGPLPPHTRAAFIWASRIPNIGPPTIRIGDADYLPATQKTPLPVDVADPGWKYLERTREWTLENNGKKIPIGLVKLGNQHAVEIDLTSKTVPPGDYALSGFWDWTPFHATGIVHVRALSDFKNARLDPASQDRLLAKSGKIAATLKGSDFEFTTKVDVQKMNDEFATPENARFLLPKGLRKGPQDSMDVQIDTADLNPGDYKLLLYQREATPHPVEFKVLPNPPAFENLPILVNQETAPQHFVLKGERLDELTRLESPGAALKLGPASDQTERSLTVELKSSAHPGTNLPVKAFVEDRSQPLTLTGALEITGPLPVLASSKLSLPSGMAIAVHSDEFPSGYTLTAQLDVKNIERKSVLRLACADGVGARADLHIGEQTAHWNLQQLSSDQLFLAYDTSGLPAGCNLEAVIDNGSDGRSKPFTLARVVLMPRIDSFVLADAPPQNPARQYQITGQNLELIGKVGWDENSGTDVSGLPSPLPGPGLKQSIEVLLTDPPAPNAPLYVWLRGDKQGRATTVKAPDLPAPPPLLPSSSTATPSAGAAANAGPQPLTMITVSSSSNPAQQGQEVTFTAQVSPEMATGTVRFMQGKISLGSATLNSGQATLTTSILPAGSLSITAAYSGDAQHAAATSPPLSQTVQPKAN